MADTAISIRALDRHCVDGICHCDWRLSIQDCEESVAMWYINIVNIAISALSAIMGIGLLIDRICFKGHTFWNPKSVSKTHGASGWLRPRPVDGMLLLFVIFNTLRLVSSVILITDVLSTNWIARSYIFEVSWDFGLAGITMYLIGIAQTISQSHSVSGWLPRPSIVDFVGSMLLFLPFTTSLAFPISAGALAETNLPLAEIFVRLTYVAWFVWTGIIGGCVLYTGARLVRILLSYHKQSRHKSNHAAVRAGIFRIQIVVGLFTVCLWGFAIFLLLYSILRNAIMSNTGGNIFLSVLWTYLGGVTTLCLNISVMLNPKSKDKNAALKSKSSTTGSNNGGTSESGAISTLPDPNTGFGESTIGNGTATVQDDNEAIFNAIKANENAGRQSWFYTQKPNRTKSKIGSHFFINNVPIRRASNASSQLELTTYDDR